MPRGQHHRRAAAAMARRGRSQPEPPHVARSHQMPPSATGDVTIDLTGGDDVTSLLSPRASSTAPRPDEHDGSATPAVSHDTEDDGNVASGDGSSQAQPNNIQNTISSEPTRRASATHRAVQDETAGREEDMIDLTSEAARVTPGTVPTHVPLSQAEETDVINASTAPVAGEHDNISAGRITAAATSSANELTSRSEPARAASSRGVDDVDATPVTEYRGAINPTEEAASKTASTSAKYAVASQPEPPHVARSHQMPPNATGDVTIDLTEGDITSLLPPGASSSAPKQGEHDGSATPAVSHDITAAATSSANELTSRSEPARAGSSRGGDDVDATPMTEQPEANNPTDEAASETASTPGGDSADAMRDAASSTADSDEGDDTSEDLEPLLSSPDNSWDNEPWVKLIAFLHPLEPIVVDDCLVFSEKLLLEEGGRVRKGGLLRGLASHEKSLQEARILKRIRRLTYDPAGAVRRLSEVYRVCAVLYMLGTLGLGVAVAVSNVRKRSSWFGQASDCFFVVSSAWVTVFAIVKLVFDDPDILRNITLGRKIYRTKEQIYSYLGDEVEVKTVIARGELEMSWLSEIDMCFACTKLSGDVHLRGGLEVSSLGRAGWVTDVGVAYDILKATSYNCKREGGWYHIATDENGFHGFAGVENLVLLHYFKLNFG